MKPFILSFSLLVSSTTHAATATLAGDQIDASIIRTVDTGYGIGRTFGYGLDGPFTVQNGNSDQHQYSSAFNLNVDGDKFSLQFTSLAGWQDGIVFRLSDLDFSPTGKILSSVSVSTNISGYTLKTNSHGIDLGLGGTSFTPDTYFIGTFVVSSVPEPTSLALFSCGLLGVAKARSKIRAKMSSCPV